MPNYVNVDYFIVGGGGGGTGGANGGSPGGAGGVRSGTLSTVVQGLTYNVTVGKGGTGTTAVSSFAGSTSTFATISASGGGAGSLNAAGGSGGSGAGGPGSSSSFAGGSGNIGSYSPVEGYAGGNNNVTSPYPAGGGGGAGAAGIAGTGSVSGKGGTGTFTTLISTTTAISLGIGQYVTATNAVYFAGGGGGGGTSQGATPAIGGVGGGGAGGAGAAGGSGTSGINYTGGGGGGGGNAAGLLGGNGGTGVVLLRTITTSASVITNANFSVSSGTYTTYIFTASGYINFGTPVSSSAPLANYGALVDVLLVAGGGGGGSDMGGGGGAGGLTTSNQYLSPGTYAITVGSGGSGAPAGVSQIRGTNGTDSMLISTANTVSYSVMFQGSQSISTPASAAFLLAGDFTVEGWLYRFATGDASMILQGVSPYFAINVNPGTGFNIYLNNATANLVVTDRVPAIQTWNHVALVRRSGIISVYLNGIASATTASNVTTLGYNAIFYIGALGVQASGSTQGYISNVRVTNGTALYTGTFTPSSIPLTTVTNTILLACSSSTYTKDYSTSSFALVANGLLAGSPTSLLWNPFNAYNTVVGGGGGASEYVNNNSPAAFGGSGGGVAGSSSVTFGLGITGQGNQGGASGGSYYPGGGGGAVLVGTSGVGTGAKGGDGFSSSLLGTTYYWAGGGGGAGYSNIAGNGGAGGGGGGAPLNGGSVSGTGGGYGNTQGINAGSNAIAGTLVAQTNVAGGSAGANTGGGGGGSSHYNLTNPGGSGGSGAVIIRYAGLQKATGGTVYSYTSGTTVYTAHAFFSSDVLTLNPSPVNPQQNGGPGGPYGGGGGGGGNWVGSSGGLGSPGSSLGSGYPGSSGSGGGGGTSVTTSTSGGGGVDIYGLSNSGSAGAVNSPGTAGSTFISNGGGKPGVGGNGGLYGGGGAGAAVSSVDTTTGNGASGALLIVYNTTASTYSYPNIMPLVSNTVNTASSILLVASTTSNRVLVNQIDNIVTPYQGLNYQSITTKVPVVYNVQELTATKESQSLSVLASNIQITTYITDHEMMLKNSDPQLIASWDQPGNYQFIQEITPANDPRLITVRVQNFVVGVTGSDSQFVTAVTSGGQMWY